MFDGYSRGSRRGTAQMCESGTRRAARGARRLGEWLVSGLLGGCCVSGKDGLFSWVHGGKVVF